MLDGLEALSASGHQTDFPFHTHPTFNISIILNETFLTKTNDQNCWSAPGSIVITNPEEVHATICDSVTGSTFFTFYLSPDVLEYVHGRQPVHFEQKVIQDKALFNGLLAVARTIMDRSGFPEARFQTLLAQLVTKYACTAPSQKDQGALITRVLEEELFEKFSLEKTAGKFRLDKYRFIRVFKQETGLTPNNYIILRRIEKCKELLHTQSDLLDIAVKTGFYDATHLCKYFKKITGVTPLAYQNAR